MRSEIFYSYLHSALEEVSQAAEEQEIRQYLIHGLNKRNFQISESEPSDSTFQFMTHNSNTLRQCVESGFCSPWAYENDPEASNIPISIRKKYLLFDAYFNHKAIIDEIIIKDLIEVNNALLDERIDITFIVETLKTNLKKYNINTPFALRLTDPENRKVREYGEFDKVAGKNNIVVRQTLYQTKGSEKEVTSLPYLDVAFPEIETTLSPVLFLPPAIAFTTILVILFVVSSIFFIREKGFMMERRNFTNNMTHELKTPVSSIRLAGEMLSDPTITLSQETKDKLLKVISQETNRLTLLIEKVLLFSVVAQRRINLSPTEINVEQMLTKVGDTYSFRVEEKGGRLETQFESPYIWILADKVHFQNVIFNLLDNAVKYRNPERPLHVVLKTALAKDCIAISICDNGLGISKEDRRKVFKQYYRINTGNRHDIKGFGLGLPYVERILSSMGGKIRVKSQLGEGTEMIILFPYIHHID